MNFPHKYRYRLCIISVKKSFSHNDKQDYYQLKLLITEFQALLPLPAFIAPK